VIFSYLALGRFRVTKLGQFGCYTTYLTIEKEENGIKLAPK
jgi:hypothetical protein